MLQVIASMNITATSTNRRNSTPPKHCTEVCFASFLSHWFITAIVVNPLERKLAKCTYVHWHNRLKQEAFYQLLFGQLEAPTWKYTQRASKTNHRCSGKHSWNRIFSSYFLPSVQCTDTTPKHWQNSLQQEGFYFLVFGHLEALEEQSRQTKSVHQTSVETRTFHATSRPVCSV